MVDCGSTSNEAVDFLNKNKIKSIIIDHHEINKPYPKANIIINPKKDNGYMSTIIFVHQHLFIFLLDLLIKKIESSFDIKKYLIHVLLATVCDVMPLRKLNRFISIDALENFDINKMKSFMNYTNFLIKIIKSILRFGFFDWTNIKLWWKTWKI